MPTQITCRTVLFKITAKTYSTETKENYPFHYVGNER